MRRTSTTCIVLHHSASPASTTREQIRRWHTSSPPEGRGWSNIGYHYLVFIDGHVEPGRPEYLVGAHCLSLNQVSIGICLVGDFAQGPVPAAQWNAALDLVSDLCVQYGIRTENVFGHREVCQTLCPGFDPLMFRLALGDRP